MAKSKGLSHETLREADEAAKAEKAEDAVQKKPTDREQLKRLKLITAFSLNDDELPEVKRQLREALDEFDPPTTDDEAKPADVSK